MTGKTAAKRSSGNVFADHGFERPEEESSRPNRCRKFATSLSVASLPRPRRRRCRASSSPMYLRLNGYVFSDRSSNLS